MKYLASIIQYGYAFIVILVIKVITKLRHRAYRRNIYYYSELDTETKISLGDFRKKNRMDVHVENTTHSH